MFENRIREFRRARGWSQQEMAEKLHVSLRTYQRCESAQCTLENLSRLAEILGTSADCLLGRNEKRLLLLVNPKAGKSKSREPLYDAAAVFSDAGYSLTIHNTAGPGEGREYLLRHGMEFGAVVTVGGDGTLSETAAALLELERPPLLGYLPQGSTNDFAASLGLSPDPAKAAAAMVRAVPRKLDMGQWNQRYFIYVASFGAFTPASYTASQSAKNAMGHFAYVLEGIRSLDTLRPYRIRLNVDGEILDGEYLFGAVCNSTSIGGLMKLDPERVVLDDGLFEVLLIPNPHTPVELQNLMMALVNQEYDSLVFRHAASLRLETEEDLPWSLDGEYAPSAAAVEIANRRQALSMLL